jgi:3-methyladenine DNA glycosylase AlkD
MISIADLKKELRKLANPEKAKILQRFFKTGKGEYGEGDIFIGVVVPQLRKIARKYFTLDLKDVKRLIESKIHEERMIAMFILVEKYEKTNHKKIVFHFYIKNMRYINNWDLVDLSAPKIVGRHLYLLDSTRSLRDFSEPSGNTQKLSKIKSFSTADKASKDISMEILRNTLREGSRPIDNLRLLARSENIWERRIGIMATFWFIKNNKFDESLKIAEMLLKDEHDLIHKAVGWMLREIGKRDQDVEIAFLNKYSKKMPRTMLRYAIERFPEKQRLAYLKKD